jgi:hypothetical protein
VSVPRRSATLLLAAIASGCGSPAEPARPPVATASGAVAASPENAGPPAPPGSKEVDRDTLVDRSFDDLKFDILPDAPFERSMLTPANEALDGQLVRIRGYILPTAQKRGIKQFVLVRDNQECCFGPGAALYDCVLVSMVEGASAEFSIRPVAVEGRLRIEEFLDPDGVTRAIYQMEGRGVR